MNRFVKIFFILLFFFIGKMVFAQQINTAKLDSLFNILSSKNLMMGRVAISKGGKIVYKKSFGYRYIDSVKKLPADENTKYIIGSVTKLFTSVMIFQLVQEHKLSLDTKLATFFPQIKNADKITIANMMHHRSGIHDASNDPIYQSELFSAKSEAEIFKILTKCPSDFEPDTKSKYSNSNFTILGYIIERLDKDDYPTSLRNRITDKLHLKNTLVNEKINATKNMSLPYRFINGQWIRSEEAEKLIEDNETAVGGAGCIVSTPVDLNIFLNALFDYKLISKVSLNQMMTLKGLYGMDIYRLPFDDKFIWGHNGEININDFAYYTDLYQYLNDKLTIAVCYNGINYNTNDILVAILSCCFDIPVNLSEFNNPQFENVDTLILKNYSGIYSSKDIPLKIKVFVQDGKLFAKATGQPAFPLSAVSEKEFIFKEAGIRMLFDAAKNEFILNQGVGKYLFKKEE